MQVTTNLIFVYGTLMQNINSQIAQYLRANSKFVGKGRMLGYLYDLGQYPAAVYDGTTKKEVFGHIFELNRSEQTLKILDEYEGIGVSDEYLRQEVLIKFETQELSCWVYLYQLPTVHLRSIESGDYLDHISDPNSEHWSFIRSV